jgi:ribosomal protein RSM22 (predicted rRNA methylase)
LKQDSEKRKLLITKRERKRALEAAAKSSYGDEHSEEAKAHPEEWKKKKAAEDSQIQERIANLKKELKAKQQEAYE